MEDKITLGKFIQSKRKELGLSQKDLATVSYTHLTLPTIYSV